MIAAIMIPPSQEVKVLSQDVKDSLQPNLLEHYLREFKADPEIKYSLYKGIPLSSSEWLEDRITELATDVLLFAKGKTALYPQDKTTYKKVLSALVMNHNNLYPKTPIPININDITTHNLKNFYEALNKQDLAFKMPAYRFTEVWQNTYSPSIEDSISEEDKPKIRSLYYNYLVKNLGKSTSYTDLAQTFSLKYTENTYYYPYLRIRTYLEGSVFPKISEYLEAKSAAQVRFNSVEFENFLTAQTDKRPGKKARLV